MGGTPLTWPSSLTWLWTIPKWRWWENWSTCCEDSLREMELFIWRKLQGDLISSFWYLKETYRKVRKEFCTRACSDRMRGNGFEIKEGRFKLDVRNTLFTCENGETLEQIVQRSYEHPMSLSLSPWERDVGSIPTGYLPIGSYTPLCTQGWSQSINSLPSLPLCLGSPWLRCRTWHLTSLDFTQSHPSSLSRSLRLASLPSRVWPHFTARWGLNFPRMPWVPLSVPPAEVSMLVPTLISEQHHLKLVSTWTWSQWPQCHPANSSPTGWPICQIYASPV